MLVLFCFSAFPEAPDGLHQAYQKLTGELSFYMGPGRFPEGLCGSNIIIRYHKQVNVSSLISVHLPWTFSRARFTVLAIPSETLCFLVLLFMKLLDFCFGGPGNGSQRVGASVDYTVSSPRKQLCKQ